MTTVLESLNSALHAALASDERVYLLGEDVLDPYGGAFKATRGLSSAFPERVLTTPISEGGFTGVAAGMALRGLRPVVEIMFGDFLTLAADQIINHAAKFRWMYSGGKPLEQAVSVPLIIRTPMGGRRGYGPTHSQTLEKHFLGTPGLVVLAPCSFRDPGGLLLAAVQNAQDPTLFIENKLQYLLAVGGGLEEFELDELPAPGAASYAPIYRLRLRGAPAPALTLVTYGYMAELARQAALTLAYEEEIFIEVFAPTQLSPFAIGPVLDGARASRRLLAVEEGGLTLGWGAEVLARAAETLGPGLSSARRCAAPDAFIPASLPAEASQLPGVEAILQAVRHMV
jgi:pyruvate/2-oxoglutarate/acetoin dehydrogenase E1 component